MKILQRKELSIDILLEGIDDLWYLQNILHPGDRILALVKRRTEQQDDMTRSKETDRKPVQVQMKVEKLDFQPFSSRIRIVGVITGGLESAIREHQSAIFSPGDIVRATKDSWLQSEVKMLDESVRESEKNSAVFVCLDEDEANIYLLRSYGIQSVAHILSGKTGKSYSTDYNEADFFANLTKSLLSTPELKAPLILLGPGFARENFLNYLRNSGEKRIVALDPRSFPASRTDESSIYEYLSSEDAKRALADARLAEERVIMDRFLSGLRNGNLSAYGMDEISRAVEMGSVSDLIASEETARSSSVMVLIEKASSIGSKIHIISSHSDPGITLKGFGGVVAILRYSIS